MSAVGGAIAGAIATAAARVGAKVVGQIVTGMFGERGGQLAETVVGTIAETLGVEPDAIPTVATEDLDRAVASAEAAAPELVLAYVESQRLANELQLAEMSAEPAWTWAWRPAGMWAILALVVWYAAIVPLINLLLGLFGVSRSIVLIVDVGTFFSIFLTYAGFYMGGHTVKEGVAKIADAVKTRRAAP